MKVGRVTSYMRPHLGGNEQIAENLFTGYTSAGVEARWVASRVPADAPPREGGRIRVPCFNLVEDVLGVPVPVWGPSGWAEIKRLVQWADAIHVLDCLYLSSAMAVMLSKRHDKPVLVSQNIGLIRYAFPPLNWIERVAYATLGRAVLRHASHVVLATPTAVAHVRTLFPDGLQGASTFPIGVDTSRFHPAAEHERQAARRSLGFAASGRAPTPRWGNVPVPTRRSIGRWTPWWLDISRCSSRYSPPRRGPRERSRAKGRLGPVAPLSLRSADPRQGPGHPTVTARCWSRARPRYRHRDRLHHLQRVR